MLCTCSEQRSFQLLNVGPTPKAEVPNDCESALLHKSKEKKARETNLDN
jgi:hypothetical protein